MYAHRYKPYNSDSDSEADASSTSESASHTGSDTDSTTSSEVQEGFESPDFKVLADGLAKPKAQDVSGELVNDTMAALIGGYEIQESGLIKPNVEKPPKQDEIIKPATKSVTNVIMLDSVDRDTKAYPQPTNVTLRLPRTYKNVTGFSILQIKLLSAFYYFSVIKQNIDISILEIGRYMVNAGQTVDNIIVNTLREGTYDINGLMTEITTQLNRTPIFYDFINGFQDFATKFSVTGDFSLNFNYPGDTYYDSLLNQFIPNPSVALIVSKYFVSQYAGLTSYTLDQIKIAYYYPVLKEISLDPVDVATVNYNAVNSAAYLLPTETVYSRIVYTFQGIFDPVILEVINLNIDLLTSYRLLHTFRYTLVNKYVVTYQTQSNQIVISSPSLNTSLVNLLTYKSSQYFAEQLSAYGISQETYNSLNSQTTILLAVLNDMVNFYQQNLAVYFGINYNTYTRDYLLNPNYSIAIRDGTNAIGITSNFTASNTVPAISCNVLAEFQADAPKYWKNMVNISSTIGYMNPSLPADSNAFSTFNYSIWNNDMDAQDSLNPIVLSNVLDSNNVNTTPIGNLYINRRTQYSDVIIPIKSSKYTTFRFKSPVRQTLRVETLPRPTKYRYPLYNSANYDLSHVNLFDMSYCFVPPIKQVDLSSNAFNPTQIGYIPGFSTLGSVTPFGSSYQTSTDYWGSNYITLSVIDTRSYKTFFTPLPPDYASVEAPAYTYPFRVSFAHPIQGQGFTTPVHCFLYQDRSAFMADISTNGNEQPTNYSYYVSTIAGYSTINLDFKAYANKQYYILLRPVNPSFPTETLRIVPWFPSSMYYNALTSSIVGFDPLADPTSNLNNYNYLNYPNDLYNFSNRENPRSSNPNN
jgi:hypothetical protein